MIGSENCSPDISRLVSRCKIDRPSTSNSLDPGRGLGLGLGRPDSLLPERDPDPEPPGRGLPGLLLLPP